MTPMHQRLQDAGVRLIEMLHPEWVGALPEALDALHTVLKQYLRIAVVLARVARRLLALRVRGPPALREMNIHDAIIEALDEVEA